MKFELIKKNSYIIIFAFLLFFKVTNVIITEPFFDNYDSPAYFMFNIYPAFRLQGVTFFYKVLWNPDLIVIFQAFVGSLAWTYFWWVLVSSIRFFIIKIIFTFLILLLSLSSVVTEWDSALLSESLSTSSILILISSFARIVLSNFKEITHCYIFMISVVFFSSVKSNNAIISIPLIIIFILLMYIKRNNFEKKFNVKTYFMILGTLLSILFFFINSLTSDVSKKLLTNGVINERLWENTQWRTQILSSGYSQDFRDIWINHRTKNLGLPSDEAVANLPEFENWWNQNGKNFLVTFTFSNLDYALVGPFLLPELDSNFKYKSTLLSGWSQGTDLTKDSEVLIRSISPRSFIWPNSPENAYFLLGLIFFTLGISSMVFYTMRDYPKIYFISLCFIFLLIYSLPIWWFGSKPSDMNRHNVMGAIGWRLIFITALCWIMDSLRFKNFFRRQKI